MKLYDYLFNFIAANRIKANDLDLRRIHSHTIVVLTTGILMWAYAVLAWMTISSPVPGLIGFFASTVHLLSPLLFRFSNNAFVISNIMIGSGMLHQGSFSYYTGGFESPVLIWYGILPLLGGIIAGRLAAIFWAVTTTIVAMTFLFLHLVDFPTPSMISETGFHFAQSFLVFGWIFLSTSIIFALLILNGNREHLLAEQSRKIDDLFRVLFHDLAGPLSRISIGLSIARREMHADNEKNGLEIVQKATEAMIEITQNVRQMYSISKGRASSDLIYFRLKEALHYVEKLYSTELDKKEINLKCEGIAQDLEVLVEPISFKNQVLGNAISNAIKFSRPGSEIVIKAYPANDFHCVVEVKDFGIGMPASILNSLFDVTKKTSRPGTKGENGNGYGMHIMKSFVEMYQGKLSVESVGEPHPESGTTVRIQLTGRMNPSSSQS
jgi:signal transduction histidine kinase